MILICDFLCLQEVVKSLVEMALLRVTKKKQFESLATKTEATKSSNTVAQNGPQDETGHSGLDDALSVTSEKDELDYETDDVPVQSEESLFHFELAPE